MRTRASWGLLLALLLPSAAAADELLVFAASSTADALREAGAAFERTGGTPVRFSFGASSDLARQILAGAPADAFLSADLAQMERLEREGLVDTRERVGLLSNALVVVIPRDSPLVIETPADLRRAARLSLADPQAVPAGVYARQWLGAQGLWADLAPKVVPSLDARAALAAVEAEAADAAIVYKTDAASTQRTRIAIEVPPELGPRIVYPVAPLARSSRLDSARKFVAFLHEDPAARAIFTRYGFGTVLAGAISAAPAASIAGAADLEIAWFTLWAAALATALILPFGIAAAWALARWRKPGSGLVETLLSLPLVLPPTAVGLLLLELFKRRGVLGGALEHLDLDVLFTWKGVVLASAVMSFPLLVRSARTAFEEVDPRLPAIGRTLGRGPAYVFWRVTLPLAWRGIAVGALLAFSRALGEFGATILVAGNIPGRTQTMALAIFQRVQLGQDASALRLAAITVIVAFAAVWTTEWITRHGARRRAS